MLARATRCAALLLLTCVFVVGCTSVPTVSEFADEWAPRLLVLSEPGEMVGESEAWLDDRIYVRHFADGTWVAARTIDYEYSHLPDAEAVEVTVLADSTGTAYTMSGRHICEGEIKDILGSVEASGVVELYGELTTGNDFGWDGWVLDEW